MDSVINYLNTPAIAALTLIIIICLYHFRPSKDGRSREPPTAAGAWPILGHLPMLATTQTPHLVLAAMANKYGPIFTIKLGLANTLVLCNWETAKECFTTNDKAVSTRPHLVATENLSYNKAMFGFAPYSPYWRELRKIVMIELLSNRRIELLGHIRVSEVKAFTKDLMTLWSSKKDECGYVSVDVKRWFDELNFNVALRTIVGKRYYFGEEKAKKLVNTIRVFMGLFGVFTVGDAVPWLRWLDIGGHEKVMKRVARELDDIMNQWLDEHRGKDGGSVQKDASDQDFMDVMLSVLSQNQIDAFDSDTITKATCLSLIVGGSDTTAVTLTWALCLLLRNPHTLEKAKEELDTVIGKERCVNESEISKLVYIEGIVKETLRLYPAGPLGGPRQFTEDCTLGGYHIKKGTRLITNLWKIHTEPSVWPDPLEFKPERFLTSHKDVDVRGHHFELLPFGAGRRICPGISFALQMVSFVLASFLHSFEIMNPSDEPVDMTGTLGLSIAKATPLEILVKPRLSLDRYEAT